ncbi:hypothetical protein FYK55_00505 [Roseiconus nitratireducens]|uniref:Uncharacterized protein n=1 Tax=Roseiconus nitratireducens TaxID=2605748 RepID=A0A5M6DLB8_9BACT|nr:hypothetical protein [Roseiconus nitratireducens]KAA5546940.1 hypothetical protein FYK55_00505 [Roseiconus nitratireducens]
MKVTVGFLRLLVIPTLVPRDSSLYRETEIFVEVNAMKQSFFVLGITGAFALASTLFAWADGGKQEDVACAIGGVAGFAAANGMVLVFRRFQGVGDSDHVDSPEIGFAYGVFAIAFFSFIGWLTGYLHEHGDFAGTVCGGLGGFILAVIVPTLHRSQFMAWRRKLQLALSVLALGALLKIVWAMYEHEFVNR